MTVVVVDWISNRSGAVRWPVDAPLNGRLCAVVTRPHENLPPTSVYNVTVENEQGLDILRGRGAGRSITAQERVGMNAEFVNADRSATREYTFVVSNAGLHRRGHAQIFFIT